MVSGQGDQVRMLELTRVVCCMQCMAASRAIVISQSNVREYKEVCSYIAQHPSKYDVSCT